MAAGDAPSAPTLPVAVVDRTRKRLQVTAGISPGAIVPYTTVEPSR